jgi:hypothetical protein
MKFFLALLTAILLLVSSCLAEEATFTLTFAGDCTLAARNTCGSGMVPLIPTLKKTVLNTHFKR